MKTLFAVMTAALLLVVPTVASAEVTYDGTVGLSMPSGDFGDAFNMGFSAGADVFFFTPAAMPQLKVGARGAFNYFGVDEGKTGSANITGGSATIIEVLPTARYSFPAQGDFSFFGQASLGFYFVNASTEFKYETFWGTVKDETDDSDTKLGFAIGGGAIYKEKYFAMPVLNMVSDANYLGLNVGMLIK